MGYRDRRNQRGYVHHTMLGDSTYNEGQYSEYEEIKKIIRKGDCLCTPAKCTKVCKIRKKILREIKP